MDLAAIAETSVEMWVLIDAKLIARKQQDLDPEIKAVIHREAMSLYMTQIINEKKYGERQEAPEQPVERPSEKQIKYAKDLGCQDPGSMSKHQLSKWIDENR